MAVENLTEGSISHHLTNIAVPLIFGNILQQFYNTVDALVIGRCASHGEFAAIGVASSVMNLFLFAIVGACTGISVIFAQCYGAGELERFRREHFLALTVGILSTLFFSAAGIAGMSGILHMIRTPKEIQGYVAAYLMIILAALPASFLYNLYNALLRAVGNTKAPLMILAVSVGGNLMLDLLFVAVFDKGIAGAAWATAISWLCSALLCAIYLKKTMNELMFRRKDCRIDRNLLQKTAHYGIAAGIHQSSLYLGKLFVQGAVNSAGTDMIAAYTATTRIEGFANSFGDSGSAATSVVTAQNYGAQKNRRVRETFRCSLVILFVMGLVSAVVMYASAEATVGYMLGDHQGIAYENGVQYIRMISLFYIFCFTGNTFAGYFDGCGKVSIPLIGAISHISLRAVLSWRFIQVTGLNGVAVFTGIGWILVNAFWAVIYYRTRQKIGIEGPTSRCRSHARTSRCSG